MVKHSNLAWFCCNQSVIDRPYMPQRSMHSDFFKMAVQSRKNCIVEFHQTLVACWTLLALRILKKINCLFVYWFALIKNDLTQPKHYMVSISVSSRSVIGNISPFLLLIVDVDNQLVRLLLHKSGGCPQWTLKASHLGGRRNGRGSWTAVNVDICALKITKWKGHRESERDCISFHNVQYMPIMVKKKTPRFQHWSYEQFLTFQNFIPHVRHWYYLRKCWIFKWSNWTLSKYLEI